MQELRFVAVSEDGTYAVLAVPGRSGRFVLPIDDRLRAIANGQTSRLAQYEIEVESPLRPKEIQARIRAGETAEEIADAAGIPVERVRWFEGPVLAERAYIADQAQAASVRRAGDSGPGPRLGDIVPARLTASGADPDDAQWDSRKRGDGSWQVTLSFPSLGRVHIAEWVFDPRRRHVMPDDDNAARLSLPESELPAEPVARPGEATVTPLAPRLGAAAGMGGGSVSGGSVGGGSVGGGFASAGPGAGVRSFRPERSVIPDRSLGADRTLAAERGPIVPRASQDHTVHHDTVHHDHASFRDVTPEPAPYYAPDPAPHRVAVESASSRAPEPAARREPVPEAIPERPAYRETVQQPVRERPAMPRPIMSRDPEPTVILSASEPAALDEQLEFAPPASSSPSSPAASPAGLADPAVSPREPVVPATPPAPATSTSATPAKPASKPTPATIAARQSTGRRPMPDTQAERTVPEAAVQTGVAAVAEPVSAPEQPTAPAPEAATPAAVAPVASPETEPEPAKPDGDTADRAADDQSARTRSTGKRNAKGRRSSVPSWDEIMLGSSRQRD